MKKIAFVIALAIMLLTFSSCGGLHSQSSIYANDSISGEDISIGIRVKRAESADKFSQFAISKDINELAEMIAKKDSSLSTAVYQEKYIVITTASSLFLIDKVEKLDEDKDDENRYYFFAPTGTFEKSGQYIEMYIPYHLMKGLANIQYWPNYENPYPKIIACEAIGTIDDFLNFYSKFEQCDVEKETDSLIVTNKKNGYKMMLTFSQNENISKVAISVL
jgi:hypothetical protein